MKKYISVILCFVLLSLSFLSCSKSAQDGNSATVMDTLSYTYDSAYAFDDITVRAFEGLCEAVVHGNEEVRINPSAFENTLQLFYTSFPLNALVENIEATDGAYKITFRNSETAHSDTLKFIEKVHNVYPNTEESDAVKLVKIYNKIASSIKPSDNSAISCYETIMTGEGTSFSYSNMFEYVLQQNGIKAYHILCEKKDGSSKAISAAELGGEIYYFDVFAEYEDNGGKLLRYFGMTSEDVKSTGIKSTIYTNREAAAQASDLRFEALRDCASWEIKDENLSVTDKNNKIVQIAL